MGGSRKGFTLIELLVVIAIIAILAAILFPVFASAKKTAQVTGCTNNLRQLALAFQRYTDDYSGVYPWGGASGPAYGVQHKKLAPPAGQGLGSCEVVWQCLTKYTGKNEGVKWCPCWKSSVYKTQSAAFTWSYWYMCSHNNPWVSIVPKTVLCGKSTSIVQVASKKVVFSDFNELHEPVLVSITQPYGMNMAFVDGHVKLKRGTHSEIIADLYRGCDGVACDPTVFGLPPIVQK